MLRHKLVIIVKSHTVQMFWSINQGYNITLLTIATASCPTGGPALLLSLYSTYTIEHVHLDLIILASTCTGTTTAMAEHMRTRSVAQKADKTPLNKGKLFH